MLREAAELTDDARLDVPSIVVCTGFTSEQVKAAVEDGYAWLGGLSELRDVTGSTPDEPLADVVASPRARRDHRRRREGSRLSGIARPPGGSRSGGMGRSVGGVHSARRGEPFRRACPCPARVGHAALPHGSGAVRPGRAGGRNPRVDRRAIPVPGARDDAEHPGSMTMAGASSSPATASSIRASSA